MLSSKGRPYSSAAENLVLFAVTRLLVLLHIWGSQCFNRMKGFYVTSAFPNTNKVKVGIGVYRSSGSWEPGRGWLECHHSCRCYWLSIYYLLTILNYSDSKNFSVFIMLQKYIWSFNHQCRSFHLLLCSAIFTRWNNKTTAHNIFLSKEDKQEQDLSENRH